MDAPAPNVGWGAWPEAPALVPPIPPHLVNYQAWLAAQGLTVQDGIVPENNITDSAAQAWNDSITVSDEASSEHSELAIAPLSFHSTAAAVEDKVTVTVDIHNQGLQFGLSAQGDALMSLLLTDPIPLQQLNNVLLSTLRHMIATMGPWSNGYGFRQDNLHVEVQIFCRY